MENNLEELIKYSNSILTTYILESEDIDELDKAGYILINDNNSLFVHRNPELANFSFIITTDPVEHIYFAEIFESLESKCSCDEGYSNCGDSKILFNSIAAVKRDSLEELQLFLVNVVKMYKEKNDVSIDDIDLGYDVVQEYDNYFNDTQKRVVDTLIPMSIPTGDSIKLPILEIINDGSPENNEIMSIVIAHMYRMRKDILDYLNLKLNV